MRVDQVITGASPGDAVTESALCLRNALREVVDADVFAWHIHPALLDEVRAISEYASVAHRGAHDLLVHHVTIGEPQVTDFVIGRPERVLLVYHNITPASFFSACDPTFAELLEHGRALLPRLVARADRAIADSDFNADELRSLGAPDVHVAAPPLNSRRLLDTLPDSAMERLIAERVSGRLVLFVGQLLPHKRVDLLVAAHHLLATNYFPDTHLVLVGPSHGRRYDEALRRYVADLGLDNVWVTGHVTDAELAAFYRRADVFVTASEHEGFCVPIIEAFSFGVPVIARDFGAVRETAGDAALVLARDSGARDLAEALRLLFDDPLLRQGLVTLGHARAQRYDLERTLPAVLEIVLDVIRRPASVP